MFTDRTSASIYKNVNRETGQGTLAANLSDDGEGDDLKDVLRQAPSRGFDGTQQQEKKQSARAKPVEFEKRMLAEDMAYSKGVGADKGLQGAP